MLSARRASWRRIGFGYNRPMSTSLPEDALAIAAAWYARCGQSSNAHPQQEQAPGSTAVLVEALAQLLAVALNARRTVLIVVPDDDLLPELSNALDLALRPLCLVLPQPGFASRIALRATLSLLKSRLMRGGEASCAEAWEDQRQRMKQHSAIWETALAWCTGNDTQAPSVVELFPACLLPLTQAEATPADQRDLLVLVWPERMANSVPSLLGRGRSVLLLCGRAEGFTTSRALALNDADARLLAERDVLTQQLSELELELATAQAELAEFTRRYARLVGQRLTELDGVEARIAWLLAEKAPRDAPARSSAEEAQAKAERSAREQSRFARFDDIDKPFAPSADLKRLFRQLAQKIHPDRAENEADRTWRTELMTEANRAYRNSDAMALRDILAQWQDGTSTAAPTPASERAREVEALQRRLAQVETELNTLLASRLYELFIAAKLARADGRDLLQEMSDKLDAQIRAAEERQAQLEAS